VRMGGAPVDYAETILAVCKSYVESPIACMSGISGSDLKKRVVNVMTNPRIENLGPARKLLLSALGIAAIVTPLVFGIVNAPLLQAQSADTLAWEKAAGGKMSFDAASVKEDKVTPSLNSVHSDVDLGPGAAFAPTGGLFSATDLPVSEYMVFAYKLGPNQFMSVLRQLPKWANTTRYDIEARATGNPTKDQMRLMMQSLLAERFGLGLHFETKQVAAMALVLDKPGKLGPQLRLHDPSQPCVTASPGAGAGQVPTVASGLPEVCGEFRVLPSAPPGRVRYGARDVTMAQFAAIGLPPFVGSDHPIVDKTGLPGTYDVVIESVPQNPPPGFQPDPDGPSLVEALKDQLGLKLESGATAEIQTIVIDHIEEPTPN